MTNPMIVSLAAMALLAVTTTAVLGAPDAPKPLPPLPTPEQLAWQRMELTMFVHFGVNTFTNREWGDGKEDPAIFNPTALDARQWVRSAKDAGFKLVILTAKHHDGFCLWPTKYTEHSVKNSPWKGGKGDVVREFVDACRAEGMKVGLYLSPWDRNNPSYGTDAYNDYFVNQLKELLTQYGQVDEMWFDGANGEGPNGKKQVYDWKRYYATIRELMPKALIAISGPDIRWVGNESGVARKGESSVRDAGPGKTGRWHPAECDVSIRPGWFYHPAEDEKVKTLDHLMGLYFKSVGRNSVLLVNVPPDTRGLFADPDLARLREFGAATRALKENAVTTGAKASAGVERSPEFGAKQVLDGNPDTYWATPDGVTTGTVELDLGKEKEFNVVSVQEAIALGERVREYHIDVEQGGQWKTVARGTIIGQRNLHSIDKTTARRLRLVIDAGAAEPAIASFEAFNAPVAPLPPVASSLASNKPVKASDVIHHGTTYGGDRAVDDDRATRWATSDDVRACWLEVDLEKPQTMNRVAIREFAPRITRFELQYRLSETDPWQTALAGEGAGLAYEKEFPPVQARYIRLNILDASAPPTIWEFGVYAPGTKPE